jgi:hypothetical protein
MTSQTGAIFHDGIADDPGEKGTEMAGIGRFRSSSAVSV